MTKDEQWAREQVLDRFKYFSRPAGFIHPARVDAALQLQREGKLICWRETHGATELLVCRLPDGGAVRPFPTGGLRA